MQLEKEIRELAKQRDLAQSRVQDLLRMVGNDQDSRQVRVCSLFCFICRHIVNFLVLKSLLSYYLTG